MPLAPEWSATDRPSISPRRVPAPPRSGGTITQALGRTAGNLPIRVPAVDWPAVYVGEKRMFRWYSKGMAALPEGEPLPRPCLLYAARRSHGEGQWEAIPAVLVACRQEPLGSITPEDVEAEGFKFLPAFKWYWKLRNKRLGWRPFEMVNVYEVQPFTEDDTDWAAQWLVQRLYGEWL